MGTDLQAASWNWMFVGSNGLVTRVTQALGDREADFTEETLQMEVAWFADNRGWRGPFDIDENGKLVVLSVGFSHIKKTFLQSGYVIYKTYNFLLPMFLSLKKYLVTH